MSDTTLQSRRDEWITAGVFEDFRSRQPSKKGGGLISMVMAGGIMLMAY